MGVGETEWARSSTRFVRQPCKFEPPFSNVVCRQSRMPSSRIAPTVDALASFESLAERRYPGAQNAERRKEYIRALNECKVSPAYSAMLPTGIYYATHSEPYMDDDTKGWQRIKGRMHHH